MPVPHAGSCLFSWPPSPGGWHEVPGGCVVDPIVSCYGQRAIPDTTPTAARSPLERGHKAAGSCKPCWHFPEIATSACGLLAMTNSVVQPLYCHWMVNTISSSFTQEELFGCAVIPQASSLRSLLRWFLLPVPLLRPAGNPGSSDAHRPSRRNGDRP